MGDRIKALRVGLGYTQKALAARIGVQYQSVQRWEKGVATPKGTHLIRLAQTFNVNPELLTDDAPIITVKRTSTITPRLPEPEPPPPPQQPQEVATSSIKVLPADVTWPIAVLTSVEIDRCLKKARFVLESNLTLYSNALQMNIETFYRSVKVEEDRQSAAEIERPPPAELVVIASDNQALDPTKAADETPPA